MSEYLFKILGRVPTKKNMMEIRWRGRFTPILVASDVFRYLLIGPNRKYRQWEHGAAKELWVQRIEQEIERIEKPIILECIFYLQSQPGRRPDLSNLLQSVEDALEKGGVIKDDGLVEGFGESHREFGVKADEERVEIKISLIETFEEFIATLPEPAYKKHVHVCTKCGHKMAFPHLPGTTEDSEIIKFKYKCGKCRNEDEVMFKARRMKAIWEKE